MQDGSRRLAIDRVLDARRPFAVRLAEVDTDLNELKGALEGAERVRRELLAAAGVAPDLEAELDSIPLLDLLRSIEPVQERVRRLVTRFSRDSLHVGVVGRARQGKSRLLQSITGLSGAEIPDGDGQHCTGVRSTIRHQPGTETYAWIHFYSEGEFLREIIGPYFEELGLGVAPDSVQDFALRPLPALPEPEDASSSALEKYRHLAEYRSKVDEYRHLIGKGRIRVERDGIRQYVAQDTIDRRRVYSNYLAVKEAEIWCAFPNTEVGAVAVVDMPGLGDTGIGDERRLVQTLASSVDVVLFARMPRPSGDVWGDVDVKLYDTSRNAIPELALHRWAFMALNRTSPTSKFGDNSRNCQDLGESIAERNIRVVDALTADFADSADVDGSILEPVLGYLASNIAQLDREYSGVCLQELGTLRAELDDLHRRMLAPLKGAQAPDSDFGSFQGLFRDAWGGLTRELEKVVADLADVRDLADPAFKTAVDEILRAAREDDGLPDEAAIRDRRAEEGSYQQAWSSLLQETRARLSARFLMVDDALLESLEESKERVANILRSTVGLGAVVEGGGRHFLAGLLDLVPPHLRGIELGLRTLADFQLAYRGLLQHRIRLRLDQLHPDSTELRPPAAATALQVRECLHTAYSEALYACEDAFLGLLAEPSQAAFAMVEEFADRVLRAKGLQDEWRELLFELRGDVWAEEFSRFGARTRSRRRWSEACEEVATVGGSVFSHLDALAGEA